MEASKFTILQSGGIQSAFHHPNQWEREPAGSVERLVIAPRDRFIELTLELAGCLQPPYAILYLLSVPRGGSEPGRYQLAETLAPDDLRDFLMQYRDFLEGDARHEIWIHSPDSSATIVYEEHNLIYAYGPLDCYLQILEGRGFEQGKIELPFPHGHHYNDVFDDVERQIVQNHAWRRTPLLPGVDD